MRSIGKFMIIAYANSILETLALLGIPLVGLLVWTAFGEWAAVGAVIATALLAGMGFSLLHALEEILAAEHGNERLVRRR